MAGRRFPFNEPVDTRYGAPHGRHGVGKASDEYVRLRYRQVPLDPYDGGGAYWGFGPPLFCAWSADRSVVRYGRAKSALLFQEMVRVEFPSADFL